MMEKGLLCFVTLLKISYTFQYSNGSQHLILNPEDKTSCKKFSCEGICWANIVTSGKRCSCNEICLYWNNCCLDFLTLCKGILEPKVTDFFLDEVDETAALFRTFGKCSYYHGPGYTNVIGRCPANATKYISDACDASDLVPLQHKKGSLLNFANVYCALCHGFNVSDLFVWEFEFHCDEYDNDWNAITENCTKSFPGVKKIEQLMCYPVPKNTEFNPDSQSLCQHYIRPIKLNDVIYRNIDCAKTDLANSSAYTTAKCIDLDRHFIFENTIKVLFDIKRNSIRIGDAISFYLCNSSQIYDPYFMVCRNIVCPPDYYAHHGQCYRNQTIFKDVQNQPFPFLNQSVKIKFSYHFVSQNFRKNFIGHEGMTLLNITEEITDPDTPLLCRFSLPRTTRSFKTFNVVAEILVLPRDDDIDLLISSLAQDKCFSRITLSNIDLQADSDLCQNGKLHSYAKIRTEILAYQRYAVVENGGQKKFFLFHSIGFKISVTKYLSTGLIDEIYVCEEDIVKHNLSCPIVIYKLGEYTKINDSIEIIKGRKKLPTSQFVIIGDEVHVCSFYDGLKLKFFEYNPNQALASLIVTCISTLCLTLSLFIYIRYKEMRTLGGKLNASLCLWLLVGQTILQVNSEVKEICYILAAVCHFAWLSAFSTMSAIAVNMALTFYKAKVSDAYEQEIRFKRLLFVSIIVPSAIVAACSGMDFGMEDEAWKVGYGKSVCTWMSNNIGIIGAFYVPICISLLVNIVSFGITLCGMERSRISSAMTSTYNQRPNRQRCLIYTKLSFIMGFTWISGIIGAIVDNEILWYVYIIMNGLQGFFIFLSFICNRRTWNIIGCACTSERFSSYDSSHSNKNANPNKDILTEARVYNYRENTKVQS